MPDLSFKVICAWCKVTLEEDLTPGHPLLGQVSHGCCKPCKDELIGDIHYGQKENKQCSSPTKTIKAAGTTPQKEEADL